MGNSSINSLSMCSGVGMLDIGLELACQYHAIDVQTVAYAERETSAAATLLARMEEQSMEPAPIWIDSLEDFPREPFCGRVDAVVAGFPCPDFSVAGKQRGTDGERYLLPQILEVARDIGARWLFLENVDGIFSAGAGTAFDEIQRTLAAFGWSPEWTTLRASDVGASHKRRRWFCVAYRADCDGERLIRATGDKRQAGSHGGAPLENANGSLCPGQRLQPRSRAEGIGEVDALGAGKEVAHSGGCPFGQANRQRESELSGETVNISLFAPGPEDQRWGDIIEQCPHLAPSIEPGFRSVAHGDAMVVDEARADQLRAAGNSVVAIQAAAAFAHLLGRFIG
ncbi:MAG: DNA cytosine methyltransferase [Opitutales bacterium]|nr:DNA cytosine methyltransferase [Opitutales bacterium]